MLVLFLFFFSRQPSDTSNSWLLSFMFLSLSYTFNFSSLPFCPSETMTLTASGGSTQHNPWRWPHSIVGCWQSSDLCLLAAHSLLFLVPHVLQIALLPIPAWLGPNTQTKRQRRRWKEDTFHPPMAFSSFPLTLASWRHISPIRHPRLAANTH